MYFVARYGSARQVEIAASVMGHERGMEERRHIECCLAKSQRPDSLLSGTKIFPPASHLHQQHHLQLIPRVLSKIASRTRCLHSSSLLPASSCIGRNTQHGGCSIWSETTNQASERPSHQPPCELQYILNSTAYSCN